MVYNWRQIYFDDGRNTILRGEKYYCSIGEDVGDQKKVDAQLECRPQANCQPATNSSFPFLDGGYLVPTDYCAKLF